MALNGLQCTDVPLRIYSLTLAHTVVTRLRSSNDGIVTVATSCCPLDPSAERERDRTARRTNASRRCLSVAVLYYLHQALAAYVSLPSMIAL